MSIPFNLLGLYGLKFDARIGLCTPCATRVRAPYVKDQSNEITLIDCVQTLVEINVHDFD